MITETFPEWDWLEYTTGDTGFVVRVRDYNYGFLILDVFFFRKEIQVPVPDYFVEILGKNK